MENQELLNGVHKVLHQKIKTIELLRELIEKRNLLIKVQKVRHSENMHHNKKVYIETQTELYLIADIINKLKEIYEHD